MRAGFLIHVVTHPQQIVLLFGRCLFRIKQELALRIRAPPPNDTSWLARVRCLVEYFTGNSKKRSTNQIEEHTDLERYSFLERLVFINFCNFYRLLGSLKGP